MATPSLVISPFQFTHPGRGATGTKRSSSERTGCFNSRTPGGVRLKPSSSLSLPVVVSIHAPREGCDIELRACKLDFTSFNSRTPGGVRPPREVSIKSRTGFQFTHPGRGATILSVCSVLAMLFQFTHPGRGATLSSEHPRP